jgi:hypothetical protein
MRKVIGRIYTPFVSSMRVLSELDTVSNLIKPEVWERVWESVRKDLL